MLKGMRGAITRRVQHPALRSPLQRTTTTTTQWRCQLFTAVTP